jgi:hypothetical protein
VIASKSTCSLIATEGERREAATEATTIPASKKKVPAKERNK